MRYTAELPGALLMLLVLAAHTNADDRTIRFSGSRIPSEILRNVCGRYATEIGKDLNITHAGGGTFAGVQDLCDGRADVAVVDRPLAQCDMALLSKAFPRQRGQLRRLLLVESPIVIVVPKNLKVRCLSLRQVRSIFDGKISNWAQVGGPRARVIRCVPARPAPTAWFFQQRFYGHQSFGEHLRPCRGDAAVVDHVEHTSNSIGVCVLPALPASARVRVVAITTEPGRKAVLPTPENVLASDYPLVMRMLKAEKQWNHDAFFDYVDRWMYEDDKEFRHEIYKHFTNYPSSKFLIAVSDKWYHQGQAWEPFVTDMWFKYRTAPGMPPIDGWKKPRGGAKNRITTGKQEKGQ